MSFNGRLHLCSASLLRPNIRLRVASQPTPSPSHGRGVLVLGIRAICRSNRFPCQFNPCFPSLSVTVLSNAICLRTSTSVALAVNILGDHAW